MRIAVLAHSLRHGGGLSVGRNMLAALARVAADETYLLLTPSGLGYEPLCQQFPHAECVVHRQRSYLQRWLFDQFELPALVRQFRPGVILALNGRGLLQPPCPQIAFPQHPHLLYPARHYGPVLPWYHLGMVYRRWFMRRQLQVTQAVMVQTRVVEQRLRAAFGYQGRAIRAATGVAPSLLADAQNAPMPAALSPLRDSFKLLYLTRYYPHKNLEGLVRTFDRFRADLAGVVAILTLRNNEHPRCPALMRSIRRLGLEDRILNVGPLPFEQVAAFYRHCDALCMPTFMETFGLPYVEAMALGLPILTSDLDFAREVCGDAALYFDPWSAKSIRDAILTLRDDARVRLRLLKEGQRQVQSEFSSWDDIARDVIDCCHTLG